MRLSDQCAHLTRQCTKTKELWELLQNIFDKKGRTGILNLKMELYSAHITKTDDVEAEID
jgi:hypothetical protein